MAPYSTGLTIFVVYVPLVMNLIFAGVAIFLFFRIRNKATAIFAIGAVLANVGPLTIVVLFRDGSGQNIQILFSAVGSALQAGGLFWYVLSLRKPNAIDRSSGKA